MHARLMSNMNHSNQCIGLWYSYIYIIILNTCLGFSFLVSNILKTERDQGNIIMTSNICIKQCHPVAHECCFHNHFSETFRPVSGSTWWRIMFLAMPERFFDLSEVKHGQSLLKILQTNSSCVIRPRQWKERIVQN